MTSFIDRPISKNSFNRFRKRLYRHYLETGEDLVHQEVEALSEALVPESMRHYLIDSDANHLFYHDKAISMDEKLDCVIQEAHELEKMLDKDHQALSDCLLLHQVLDEQTTVNDVGKLQSKPGKEITPESIQNPAEPEATYRNKAGKHHFGYVANVIETVGKNGKMITDYDVNSYSDVKFCEEFLEKTGTVETETTLVADGSYNSTNNREQAAKQNIQFAPTNLNGKAPTEIKGDFEIKQDETIFCPAGHQAVQIR